MFKHDKALTTTAFFPHFSFNISGETLHGTFCSTHDTV